MKEIPLRNRKKIIVAFALVDDEDYEFLMQWKWYFAMGYALRDAKGIRMHRVIMNAPSGTEVDHINQNRLDCQRCNLRIASHGQNRQNTPKYKGCSSQYKGVSWRKKKERWVAGIGHDQKWIHLGYFDSEIAAAHAYDAAALMYHGEFAYLNFPKTDSANRGVSE
jgi:AP2 domain-containing protein/HNH endonuclease